MEKTNFSFNSRFKLADSSSCFSIWREFIPNSWSCNREGARSVKQMILINLWMIQICVVMIVV